MPTGREIAGFRLLRQLGAGGMGMVWLAEHGDRRVALKIVHSYLAASDEARRRFLREGEIGRRVRHENVVATLGVGETRIDGRPALFLAMEYVEGRTLRAMLAELGRLPEDLCRQVGCDVAKALAALHAVGAAHRDVKPDNVIITTESHVVKLMDLGVAKDLERSFGLSKTGAFVGTLQYAAPEQLLGGKPEIDPRVDQHGLGVTLYELATGVHPFHADDIPGVITKILNEPPRRMSELVPEISPFFEEVVLRLLAKDPTQRFASAEEVARILGEGEGGGPGGTVRRSA